MLIPRKAKNSNKFDVCKVKMKSPVEMILYIRQNKTRRASQYFASLDLKASLKLKAVFSLLFHISYLNYYQCAFGVILKMSKKSENVRVAVRCRPISQKETDE